MGYRILRTAIAATFTVAAVVGLTGSAAAAVTPAAPDTDGQQTGCVHTVICAPVNNSGDITPAVAPAVTAPLHVDNLLNGGLIR